MIRGARYLISFSSVQCKWEGEIFTPDKLVSIQGTGIPQTWVPPADVGHITAHLMGNPKYTVYGCMKNQNYPMKVKWVELMENLK